MTELPNWFLQGGVPTFFNKHLSHLKMQEIHCLQIGAYKGDASLWLFENILLHPDSTLTDVDTWSGSDEVVHASLDWNGVEAAYDSQLSTYLGTARLRKNKSSSDDFFRQKPSKQFFDFIYVDGDHDAVPVLKDGINSMEALKVGGILAFDDYTWGVNRGLSRRPKAAIDAILQCYADRIQVLEIGHQVWLKKIL
jgi:predicted O-methyltransferase YrrM